MGPDGVRETLALAGKNKQELLKVIHTYAANPEDSLKYRAALFLIDNMKWHSSNQKVESLDSGHIRLRELYDEIYRVAIRDVPDDSLNSEKLRERLQSSHWATQAIKNAVAPDTPRIVSATFYDPECISADFLIQQIESAFEQWQHSPYAKHLEFDEFCEWMLPYRNIIGYPYFENHQTVRGIFEKQLSRTTQNSVVGLQQRYLHYTNSMRFMSGLRYRFRIGLYDAFFLAGGECIPLADNMVSVFRACGVPCAVEYNLYYKERIGKHFYCSYLDSLGIWHRFNPGSLVNDSIHPLGTATTNIFKSTFSAQKDAPYFLAGEDECLPTEFCSPCFKEITGENCEVCEVDLPFHAETPNQLAYLYAFQKSTSGLVPATWGKIDHGSQSVTFENVIYDAVYYPHYLEGDVPRAFGEPFYITHSDRGQGFEYNTLILPESSTTIKMKLLRKYPIKKYLHKMNKDLIGTCFQGANKSDFSDAVTLYTITEHPQPYLQECVPVIRKTFRYFRQLNQNHHPDVPFSLLNHLIVSLEFIVISPDAKLITQPAMYLPVFSPDDPNMEINKKDHFCILDQDEKQRIKWPTWCSHLEASVPVTVEKIRFAPRNAGNHIVVGDNYELMYWDNIWKSAGIKRARYNFLEFDDVPGNTIYWLKNLTKGQEEMPFLYENGEQLFIYGDVIKL